MYVFLTPGNEMQVVKLSIPMRNVHIYSPPADRCQKMRLWKRSVEPTDFLGLIQPDFFYDG